ncbi:alpha/beta fold hydrolase [Sporosalibacterium faouarense]|uniref:alpha/beta fold hydrolase n=1 Tax=Sporosalibacterium faouarense TaxID=516123 RepID=UPI00141C76C5|nr:alpha/beta fold hydrolase [Sporosalibacterium faouarense]MTI46471.1 alpha/beta fold hydrolase [Bacillota bacterium]
MGHVKANGINIYYEIYGDGIPLVLIGGLGYSSWIWYKQVHELSKDFRVIVYDNRGIGKTDMPDTEYTIEIFADDLAELLIALDIKHSHILGFSMGGYIAQYFAIKYPDMIDKLILCSTSYGGPNCIPIPKQSLRTIFAGGEPLIAQTEARAMIEMSISRSTQNNKNTVEELLEKKTMTSQPKYAYQRQLMAAAGFNVEDELQKIKSETLILSGREDKIIPSENSQLLSRNIPGSKVYTVEDAGHLFFIEKAVFTNKLIVEFLKDSNTSIMWSTTF